MATSPRQNEILKLQSEITQEVTGDAKAIATGVFGDNANHPDMRSVPNQQLDDLYRSKYQANDRQWLQSEARRDPQQFLDVAKRIGVSMPPPGAPPPVDPNAFAQAVMANAAPVPAAAPAPAAPVSMPPAPVPPALPVAPPSAPPPPLTMPPGLAAPAAPPVILGPNGQPLPPGGIAGPG
jgi:hypothetical protein